jgi:hypothetical protein
VAIYLIIALRVARFSQGASVGAKIVASIFGVMSTFFVLDVQSYRHFWNDVTASKLSLAKDNGAELSPFALNWIEQAGLSGSDLAVRGLFNDPALLAFITVLLIIILGTIWGPKINFGNDT